VCMCSVSVVYLDHPAWSTSVSSIAQPRAAVYVGKRTDPAIGGMPRAIRIRPCKNLAKMPDAETCRGLGIGCFTRKTLVDLSGIEPLTF